MCVYVCMCVCVSAYHFIITIVTMVLAQTRMTLVAPVMCAAVFSLRYCSRWAVQDSELPTVRGSPLPYFYRSRNRAVFV